MNPYRGESVPRPPALWLPGVVCVEDGVVRLGPLAGWRTARGIFDWKREVVVVEKAGLPLERRPEARLERFPRLKQAALACPVVAFAPDGDAPDGRRIRVAWHRGTDGGYIGFEEGDPAPGVGGELYGIPVLSVDGQPPDAEDPPLPSADQILRAISDGKVSEEAVELATDLLDVLDAPLAPREEAEREVELAHWEAWLEQRFSTAAPHEEEARALARTLAAAPPGDTVTVPFYGEARRARTPPMVIRCSDDPRDKLELSLPALEHFEVAAVEEPLGYHLHLAQRRRRSLAGLWFVAAFALACWWLLWR